MRSEWYVFKCGDDSKNNIKGISKTQSKHNNFEEYQNCIDIEEYQNECVNYILRAIDHEMCLQKVRNSTLSQFDDKRC